MSFEAFYPRLLEALIQLASVTAGAVSTYFMLSGIEKRKTGIEHKKMLLQRKQDGMTALLRWLDSMDELAISLRRALFSDALRQDPYEESHHDIEGLLRNAERFSVSPECRIMIPGHILERANKVSGWVHALNHRRPSSLRSALGIIWAEAQESRSKQADSIPFEFIGDELQLGQCPPEWLVFKMGLESMESEKASLFDAIRKEILKG